MNLRQKQTKDNFINKKVQWRPTYTLIHLLIIVPGFLLGGIAGAAALGGPEIPHDQQQSQIVLLAPHQDRTRQGWRCTHAPSSLNKLQALPVVVDCNLKDLVSHLFLGHFGHMTELT